MNATFDPISVPLLVREFSLTGYHAGAGKCVQIPRQRQRAAGRRQRHRDQGPQGQGLVLVVKVGTKVKNIRLVEGDHDIDCKIDGIGAMKLKSEFVKSCCATPRCLPGC
jgi:hypothetical protein